MARTKTQAYLDSLIEAGRGNLERARELAATGVAQAEAQSDWGFAAQCRTVLGLAELSADDPAAALRWLEPVADMLQDAGHGEPGAIAFTPDLIEAWAATGQLDRAADRLAWLKDAAQRLGPPMGADHQRPRRSRPPAGAARPGRGRHAPPRRSSPKPANAGCRSNSAAASSPWAPRSAKPASAATPRQPSTKPPPSSPPWARSGGKRWPRPSAPALHQATMTPSRRLSGASPT